MCSNGMTISLQVFNLQAFVFVENKRSELLTPLLAKLIPQNIVFALNYEGKIQLAICHNKLIAGVWSSVDDYKIELKGLNLDKIWESLITDIGEIIIEEGNTLDSQIEKNDAEASLKKRIEDLEKKARAEKQPRKLLELFEQIKSLKR